MKILISLLIGTVYIFGALLSLIFVGKILEQIKKKIEWLSGEIFQWIFFVILYVLCIGLMTLFVASLTKYFQLPSRYFGIGMIIGMFLYIPFSRWTKLYSK